MGETCSDGARIIVLCGGSPHAHDFAAIGSALRDVLSVTGRPVVTVDHPDRLEAAIGSGVGADIVVVHGLWWRMLGDAYEPWRAAHAFAASESVRRTLHDHVSTGGGLIAMHTAPICFDDWPEWGAIIGASWVWGRSSHPPPADVDCVVEPHAVTDGLGGRFRLVDEVYGDLAMGINGQVVVRARRHADDPLQPIVWTHRFGSGRVVADLLGHDAASISDPAHQRLLHNAVAWVAHADAGDTVGSSSGRI